jgi:hypothetical protein
MIDDIDIIIRNQQDASNNRSSYQFDKMKQFKNDIIRPSTITSRLMGKNFAKLVHTEQQKRCFNRNNDESQPEQQVSVINAIETRQVKTRHCC